MTLCSWMPPLTGNWDSELVWWKVSDGGQEINASNTVKVELVVLAPVYIYDTTYNYNWIEKYNTQVMIWTSYL